MHPDKGIMPETAVDAFSQKLKPCQNYFYTPGNYQNLLTPGNYQIKPTPFPSH